MTKVVKSTEGLFAPLRAVQDEETRNACWELIELPWHAAC